MNSFISIETGDPGALSVYLRRTSAAFNELVQIHKDIKAGRSDRKRKKDQTLENGNLIEVKEKLGEDSYGYEEDKIRKKEKKKKKISDGSKHDNDEILERESVKDEVKKKSKERKKRKKEEAEDGQFDNSEEQHIMKKKKKRKHENQT